MKDVAGFSGWSWRGCSFSFPDRLISEIKATPISFYARNADRINWSSSPNGNFKLKEAYKLAILDEEGHYTGCFDGIGFGRHSLSQKLSVLCGSAFTRAFRSALFLQQEVWKFHQCVSCVGNV